MRRFSSISKFGMLMAILLSSCASTPTITWTPKGGETATLELEASVEAEYLAIRSVDGQFQANPWTFYIPSTSPGSAPELLGEGQAVNAIAIDASTEIKFELGFYQPKTLLQQDKPEWHKSKPVITLKPLDPKGKYTLVLSATGGMILGGPASGKKSHGMLTLRKGLFENVQAWSFFAEGDNIEVVETEPTLF